MSLGPSKLRLVPQVGLAHPQADGPHSPDETVRYQGARGSTVEGLELTRHGNTDTFSVDGLFGPQVLTPRDLCSLGVGFDSKHQPVAAEQRQIDSSRDGVDWFSQSCEERKSRGSLSFPVARGKPQPAAEDAWRERAPAARALEKRLVVRGALGALKGEGTGNKWGALECIRQQLDLGQLWNNLPTPSLLLLDQELSQAGMTWEALLASAPATSRLSAAIEDLLFALEKHPPNGTFGPRVPRAATQDLLTVLNGLRHQFGLPAAQLQDGGKFVFPRAVVVVNNIGLPRPVPSWKAQLHQEPPAPGAPLPDYFSKEKPKPRETPLGNAPAEVETSPMLKDRDFMARFSDAVSPLSTEQAIHLQARVPPNSPYFKAALAEFKRLSAEGLDSAARKVVIERAPDYAYRFIVEQSYQIHSLLQSRGIEATVEPGFNALTVTLPAGLELSHELLNEMAALTNEDGGPPLALRLLHSEQVGPKRQ